MFSTGGSSLALDSSRRRFAFCLADKASCMGCSVRAFRYAVAKLEKAEGVWGIFGMRLKLGNSNAVVAPGCSLFGNEEAVMRTFVNG
jgi:hypothetical protein